MAFTGDQEAYPESAAEPHNPFPREVVLEAVERFGTPHYLYDETTIRERCAELTEHLPGEVHYAMKANSNLEVLRIIRDSGLHAEAVSIGEVERALEAGFTPEQIVYTCHGAPRREIEQVVGFGIPVNADSLHQLEWICEADGSPDGLQIRISGLGAGQYEQVKTGGPGSKFGIRPEEFSEARRIADLYGKRITGLHQHIGSNVLNPEELVNGVRGLIAVSYSFPGVESLDFGGGLGVRYRPGEPTLDLKSVGSLMGGELQRAFGGSSRTPRFSFEPGRYPVAEAGVLNMTATDRKKGADGRTIVSFDSGFPHTPRGVLYGAYHHLVNVSYPQADLESAMPTGLFCESGDRFATAEGDEDFQREIPRFEIDDIASQLTAGAYVEAMASEFNSRPKPPAVLLQENGELKLIG
jgi:diaminopimelate decarboxylase